MDNVIFLEQKNFSIKDKEIAEWLLTHKDGLEDKIKKEHNPAYQLFPDKLFEIYLDNYANNIIDIIKKEIPNYLNLTPEDYLTINKKFVTMILGDKFLIP